MRVPLKLTLVGPLPPPSGGMANQSRQLARLLESEGLMVDFVQTNAPYRPAWVAPLRGVRAGFRLVPYVLRLYRSAGQSDVVHVMANSGWAWHVFAAPAIWIARLRNVPVVVNYRGGLAEAFLRKRGTCVRRSMSRAAALVVPTRFLQDVFGRHDMSAQIIPNVVDTATFFPGEPRVAAAPEAPHLVVTRNLEKIYGNDIALQAFAQVRARVPDARLTIAGSGPERSALERLVRDLGIAANVCFAGRLETAEVANLYRTADIAINPSRADNTPNSVLEALACGVPVVSTNVGGLPCLVQHGSTAWLVPPDDPAQLANAILQVLGDASLRGEMIDNGLALARGCSWSAVRMEWLDLYARLANSDSLRRDTSSQVD